MLHQSNYQTRDSLGRFASEGRTERLTVRLTPDELKDIRFAADARNLSMTRFIAIAGMVEAHRLRSMGIKAARVTTRGDNMRS